MHRFFPAEAPMAALTYPPTCTKAAWEKQKAVLIKLLKEDTGMGAAVVKAEEAFKKIKWAAIDGPNGARIPKLDGLDDFIAGIEDEQKTHILPAQQAAEALAKVATATHAKFKANPKIPKTSVDYSEDVATDAKELAADLKTSTAGPLKMVKAARERLATLQAKNAMIPELIPIKKNVLSGKFGYIEGNAKVYAAFRKYCDKAHLGDQLDAWEACQENARGEKAVKYYLQYIKDGAPDQANVAASLRSQFDEPYDELQEAKKSGNKAVTADKVMVNLPWKAVGAEIVTCVAQRITEFANTIEDYW
jgi:hypothetical protein